MKKRFCTLLALTLCISLCSGCDRRSPAVDAEVTQSVEFAPEATALDNLVQAMETQDASSLQSPDASASVVAESGEDGNLQVQSASEEQPVAQDSAIVTTPTSNETSAQETSGADTSAVVQPFISPTPQPNTAITSYSEVTASGLGFKFSYPSDWINIPGYSTVCYVQPTGDGTVYPARVAVTMKRLAHKCSEGEDQQELASYLKTLMTQYDEKTFKVDMNLDTGTKFMNNSAISTTYLAYDGTQEIQGYVILTYFERYLFCFHFLCAYEDYAAFEPAMRHMRDSVQADQTQVAPQ